MNDDETDETLIHTHLFFFHRCEGRSEKWKEIRLLCVDVIYELASVRSQGARKGFL